MSKIVFVCTGNTCRSPMAEGIFNALSEAQGKEHYALSCGLSVLAPLPASENAVAAAAEFGADINNHRARRAAPEIFSDAAAVYCMTAAHLRQFSALFPEYASLARLMPPPCGEVPDPYGGSLSLYTETAAKIYEGVKEILDKLP
ncbi:MAG: low molecular weight protein arginine phosphatase [Papillibacter sp.]|jgi:protein-tyrosine phosphatase|nr:low molecular weight protein arginine phosphatase [Papillibacter sp.]